MINYFSEKSEYDNIREKSVEQWLNEMADHSDIAVRGGVKVTREYIADLQDKIDKLKEENELKNMYLKKMKGAKNEGKN